MVTGIGPLRKLYEKYNSVNSDKFPIDSGIPPEKALNPKFR
jgi:hypothetical protein